MFKAQSLKTSIVGTYKTSIVGTYKTLQAASKQVDLLFRNHQDVRANIVASPGGFTVHAVYAQ